MSLLFKAHSISQCLALTSKPRSLLTWITGWTSSFSYCCHKITPLVLQEGVHINFRSGYLASWNSLTTCSYTLSLAASKRRILVLTVVQNLWSETGGRYTRYTFFYVAITYVVNTEQISIVLNEAVSWSLHKSLW